MAKVLERSPGEQAKFWLNQVERLRLSETDRADVALGAAWILDAPALDREISKQLKIRDSQPVLPINTFFDLEGMVHAFETLCRETRQNLAARATKLQPDYAPWRRMRALLLFTEPAFGSERHAHLANWREFLDDARSHDPDNALYDLLAAHKCWTQSAAISFTDSSDNEAEDSAHDSGHDLQVHDADVFAEGLRHWEQGLTKRVMRGAEEGRAAIPAFLAITPLSSIDQCRWAQHCQVNRVTILLVQLSQWLQVMADKLEATGDTSGALARRLQLLHVIEQFIASAESEAIDLQAKFTPVFHYFSERIRQTWQDHPDLADADDVGRLDRLIDTSERLAQIYATAVLQMRSDLGISPDSPIAKEQQRRWNWLRTILMATFGSAIFVLSMACFRPFRPWAKRFLVLPLLGATAFFALAPATLRHNEALYQWIARYYRSPEQHTKEVRLLLRTHGFNVDVERDESTRP